MKILAVIIILGLLAVDDPSDSTMIKKKQMMEQKALKRSYESMQKQLIDQNLKLDSLIRKLQNDTITRK